MLACFVNALGRGRGTGHLTPVNHFRAVRRSVRCFRIWLHAGLLRVDRLIPWRTAVLGTGSIDSLGGDMSVKVLDAAFEPGGPQQAGILGGAR